MITHTQHKRGARHTTPRARAEGGSCGGSGTLRGLPLRRTMGAVGARGGAASAPPGCGCSGGVTTGSPTAMRGLFRLPGGRPRRRRTSPVGAAPAPSGKRGSVPGVDGGTSTRARR